MVPALVDSDSLERANGLLTGTESGTEHLAGPVVGTWLFTVGKAIPFLADSVALMLSTFPFFKLRAKEDEKPPLEESPSIWEGAKLLFADRRLRVLLVMVSCLAGLQGMEAGVLVLLATMEWGVRTGAYGLFLAVGAVGNLVGSLFISGLAKRFGTAQTLIGTAIASGAGYLIMASAHSWRLAGPGFFLVGFAVAAGSVAATSLRQRLTPQTLMGRVGSAWRGIVWGAAPVGALAAGTLASVGGLRLPLVLAGILQCAVADPARSTPSQEHPSRRGRPQPRCGASRKARGRSLPQCGGGLRLSTGRQSAVRQPSGRLGTAVPSDCRATALLLTGIERGGPKRGSEQG